MVINRKAPNTHTINGFTFHTGAQFVADAFFVKSLEENGDFKAQLDSGLMEIVVPVAESDDKQQGRPKRSLAETVVSLPEAKALAVVAKTVDGVDLKEISKLDKRRSIVQAAEKQIELRQGTMNGMAPRLPTTKQGPIEIGEFE